MPDKKKAKRAKRTRKASSVRQAAVRIATSLVKAHAKNPFVLPGSRDWSDTVLCVDERLGVRPLLRRIRRALPKLERLLQHYNSHWGFEDPIYRFYHQSWKVYGLEDATLKIVAELQALAPGRPLNAWFMAIIKRGTPMKRWKREDNDRWLEVTAPMVEAFFHARYFLEMAVRYGKELKQPIQPMPSGWAALLALYGL
jgi:hypothetical protein